MNPWAATTVEGSPPPDIEAHDPVTNTHEWLVRDELRKLRARAEARARFAAEQAPDSAPFDAATLAEVLARPADPAGRVEALLPWEASTLIVAQRKTGKTTLLLNLARAVLTGEDFLGRFPVQSLDGQVALLNYEVSAAQVARWAAEVGVPANRLLLVNTRGRRNPLRDTADRAALAAYLRSRGIEMLMVDPFGRAYTGASQNDAGEVGAFLVALDQFARAEVGATDLILTAHAGWNGERTRGSSALEDWADALLTLTGDDDTDDRPDRPRYLRAIGRDVDLPEDQLHYDAQTRRLSLTGAGSRKTARSADRVTNLAVSVMSVLIATPGLTGRGVTAALTTAGVSYRKGEELRALRDLVTSGRVRTESGPRNSTRHYPSDEQPTLTPPPPSAPTAPGGQSVTAPRAPIGGRSHGDTHTHESRGHSRQDTP